MIVRPAAQRTAARRAAERGKERPATLKRMPTREEYVQGGVMLGGDADAMGKAYDAWAAKQRGAVDGEDT